MDHPVEPSAEQGRAQMVDIVFLRHILWSQLALWYIFPFELVYIWSLGFGDILSQGNNVAVVDSHSAEKIDG